jgi:hypothetical protein
MPIFEVLVSSKPVLIRTQNGSFEYLTANTVFKYFLMIIATNQCDGTKVLIHIIYLPRVNSHNFHSQTSSRVYLHT